MGDKEATTEEILSDLERLDVPGRRRYMEVLSREKLADLLALSLEMRDEEKENANRTPIAQGRKRLHDSPPTERFESKKEAKTTGGQAQVELWEDREYGTLRRRLLLKISTAPLDDDGTDVDDSIVSDGGEEYELMLSSTQNDTAETADPPVSSHISQQISTGDILDQTSPNTVKELPLVLLVPGAVASLYSVVPIKSLPAHVHRELKSRLIKTYTYKGNRQRTFKNITRSPSRSVASVECMRRSIVRGRLYRPHGLFTRSGEPQRSADDQCIGQGCPYAHVIEHEGHYAICLAPLPRLERTSHDWQQLGFLVKTMFLY